ncbi:MAG: tRNA (N6-isopentenyl adenosine(37)-C2)-methylthiotransferase MiaB [Rhizobiales bacterium]|nr:tRNA (N6-isopentenyl adenosine(37)-C2)-methylthiotransferase MiaB [Hyphomicrobiales bacterium]
MTKKIFIKSYGCQMNVYDSERMAELMDGEGYEQTDDMSDADMVVLNTCHIREKAAEKVYSELGRVRKNKEERSEKGKETIIAVAGCVAQAEGEEIIRRAPVVDMVVGPQSYQNLPELLDEFKTGKKPVIETEFPEEDKFGKLPGITATSPCSFVTVQEGCDKFCTFCVVPYTRGGEFSRSAKQIIDDANRLVDQGVHELTLLGQNVNGYHGEGLDGKDWSLARLLDELSKIEGIERLRYTTSHPRDMEDDLIHAHRDNPLVMPYLHLPFQSGSDKILKDMNRRHTREFYIELVERIREGQPDLALSTDIIVGFPGETDKDFQDTMDMVETIGYASAYSFKYSPRPGTPAAEIEEQIDEEVKKERLAILQKRLTEQQKSFNESKVGSQMTVLLEKIGRNEGQLIGRSPYLQSVHLEAEHAKIGDMVDVTIKSATLNSLQGVINPSS